MRYYAVAFLVLTPLSLHAADWPHWLGPNGNGSTPETGLLFDWPKTGPKMLWKVEGGEGFSTIAVADGRAVTMVQKDGEEQVLALDAASGKTLWRTKIGPAFKNSYGNGPRSTPALEGKFVYVQSVAGPVVCLDAATGQPVWQRDLLKEHGGKNITWGLSASPVIDGDRVYVLPGAKGCGVAALDKNNGKPLWKAGDDKAAYASPVAVTVAGQRQAIFFNASGLLGLNASDGKELWRVPWPTQYDCNICTPLVIDDKLFVTSGEKNGCVMLQLVKDGPPKKLWDSKGEKSVMMNYWANSVYHDGHLYGLSGEFDKVINFNCVDAATGELRWSRAKFGKGAITLGQGHLFVTTKTGDLLLLNANPKGYLERARIRLLGENRTTPTIANRRLYARDEESIYCFDVAE